MRKLEEYQKHIRDTHADHAGKALCGEYIGLDFYFVDISHWFNTARLEEMLQGCPGCLAVVLKAIKGDMPP